VPKSIAIAGPGTSAFSASALRMRSAPTSAGARTLSFRPRRDRGVTAAGLTPKALRIAASSVASSAGTTEP
jgi:hypothetical protein